MRIRAVPLALVPVLLAPALAGATPPPHPVTDLVPAAIHTQGPDRTDAHIEGQRLVHGDLRVRLPGRKAVLVGYGVENHVVSTRVDKRWVTFRVDSDGTRHQVATGLSPYSMTYGEDGRVVASSRHRGVTSTVVVWSTADGSEVARRSFADGSSVLALDGSRVVLGSWSSTRTRDWRLDTDRVRTIAHQVGYRADLTHGLLATFTADPYDNGCSVLRRLDRPATGLWRSCGERVEKVSPDGKRVTTVTILSDGVGPSQVNLRTVRGRWQAAWRVKHGWIDVQGWENSKTWAGVVHSPRLTADVRCKRSECELAG